MSDCLFCKMVDGDIPVTKVYEDDSILAFLDIKPLARGHTLVVPKVHSERLTGLTPDQAADYFRAVPALVRAVEMGVNAHGTTLAWNNGRAAGQEVGHVHLHIVPRFEGDEHGPIHALFGGGKEAEGLDKVAGSIRSHLE